MLSVLTVVVLRICLSPVCRSQVHLKTIASLFSDEYGV